VKSGSVKSGSVKSGSVKSGGMSDDPGRGVSLIVAVADNGVIGSEGDLPWRLSSDLRRFKRLTMGHHLIMGRKTYDSIGRPLPGRTTIVITRQADYQPAAGVLHASSLSAAVALAGDDNEPFITGGAQIYALALSGSATVTRIYRTRVLFDATGDTHFPPLDETQWRVIESNSHPATSPDNPRRADHAHVFEILERIPQLP